MNAKFLALAKVIMNYEKQLIHDWKIDIHASLDASLTQPILCKDKDGALRVNFPSTLIGRSSKRRATYKDSVTISPRRFEEWRCKTKSIPRAESYY